METVVVEITVCDKPCIIFYDFRPNSHALSKAFDYYGMSLFFSLGSIPLFSKGRRRLSREVEKRKTSCTM